MGKNIYNIILECLLSDDDCKRKLDQFVVVMKSEKDNSTQLESVNVFDYMPTVFFIRESMKKQEYNHIVEHFIFLARQKSNLLCDSRYQADIIKLLS